MITGKRVLALGCLCSVLFCRVDAGEPPAAAKVRQHCPSDLRFVAKGVEGNPFMVDFSAELVGPENRTLKVPGFYDGKDTWVIRFAAPLVGAWSYRTASSVPLLNGKTGQLEAVANTSPTVHGRLRVDTENPYHFIFEDGTRYFLLGFECDWLWALDANDPKLPNVRPFLDLLAERGFNHIVTNVYAHDCGWSKGKSSDWDYGPPPIYPWGGTNASPDFSALNLAFWKHYDRVVDAMLQKGIVAHIMLRVYNKMVRWPKNGSAEDDLYYRYVVARYAAYPNVVWDFSKEAHNEKDADYKIAVINKIKDLDPYDNLVTVHDDNKNYDNGNYDICDFRSDQQHSKWGETILEQRTMRRWPVLNIEYGYERGVDDLPTYGVKQDWQEVLRRTWEICCAGGYCNYYYSNTSWDLIKWSPEPPGWKPHRVLRDFLESTRWWGAEPHQDLVVEGRAWCLADPGREYIVFSPRGGKITIRLAEQKSYSVMRLDPYTGANESLPEVAGGDRPIDLPPDHPWVLQIMPK